MEQIIELHDMVAIPRSVYQSMQKSVAYADKVKKRQALLMRIQKTEENIRSDKVKTMSMDDFIREMGLKE